MQNLVEGNLSIPLNLYCNNSNFACAHKRRSVLCTVNAGMTWGRGRIQAEFPWNLNEVVTNDGILVPVMGVLCLTQNRFVSWPRRSVSCMISFLYPEQEFLRFSLLLWLGPCPLLPFPYSCLMLVVLVVALVQLCRVETLDHMNQNIRIVNESFKNVATFKCFGTTLTNQNDILDEIKSRLNSGNACYHSVQNLLSSRLIYGGGGDFFLIFPYAFFRRRIFSFYLWIL
jgi:hypothetical protein